MVDRSPHRENHGSCDWVIGHAVKLAAVNAPHQRGKVIRLALLACRACRRMSRARWLSGGGPSLSEIGFFRRLDLFESVGGRLVILTCRSLEVRLRGLIGLLQVTDIGESGGIVFFSGLLKM